ncbi:DUF6049 family protein [Blastococcus goldschmidtiae]|uniref:DUF6049 family protein n=1 Tax=Blastococcus goldschmidtiae TaxID=3075546 RepID=A0ABU2K2J1_9ACTN|nr:DUF6049 family protein [Blastococcus sp. DSM 46792]MDT0274414.1 DUF6049 family protein [Blastococcus sp. DSM 46792]
MSRSAAGGAGGRPAAASGSVRTGTRPGALLRTAVVLLLLATLAVLAPPASAAPATPALPTLPTLPALADDPADDARDPERPVQIEVSRFEPRTVTPGSLVTVTGTLTNTGTAPVEDLNVRLQRGDVLLSRAELAAEDLDPDPATTVVPPFQAIPELVLEPGAEVPFSYTVDSAELQLDRDGVYPVLLNVNGSIDGDTRRVGELSTYVVQQPLLPAATTAVAWLWPLTERTHRDAAGRFVDDGLAESVSEGGRLDRALGVIERLPRSTLPGASAAEPALPVTLAIDPALVEALQVMAAGDYEVAGGTGSGTEAAAAFLERLRAVAAVHPVVALPYGDVDVDALDAADLGDVVTRSLPGTPAGTAQDPPGSPAGTAAEEPLLPAGGTDVPAEEQPAPEDGAGARILADALDVEPRTDLAWAPGGTLSASSLARLSEGGIDEVVLAPGALTTGDSAVGLTDPTAAASVTLTTADGPVDALVADARLSDVVARSEHTDGGPRLAQQRYLAELALLNAQAPPGSTQTVLIAPPREIDAGPDGVGAMMADTASLPWLRAATVSSLAAGPRSEDGALLEPVGQVRLDAAGLAVVDEAVAARDDLAGAVVGDPALALQAFDAAVARATSVAWRDDPAGFRAAADDLAATMQRLRNGVTLLAPADGTYTLASSDAPLVLTVRNDLPFAVRVLPQVRSRGNRAISVGDVGVQVLAPGSRTVLQVPTSMRQSGGVAVTAALTTPGGGTLGERVEMQVRSTAYGPISLIITIGAAALLALLFLRRLVHFLLRRRARATGSDAGVPPLGPDGPPTPVPTRSPV